MASKLLLVSLQGTPITPMRQGFVSENFLVDSAHSAERAASMIAMRSYDALVVCAQTAGAVTEFFAIVRTHAPFQYAVIVFISTVRLADEVALLHAGATICKSSNTEFREVLAHTRALLRRINGYPRHHRIADLGVDPVNRRASRRGTPLSLRPIEFDILVCLAEHVGTPVSKHELLLRLWPNGDGSANRLAAHVRNLRAEVDPDRRSRLLHTVRHVGYVLRATL